MDNETRDKLLENLAQRTEKIEEQLKNSPPLSSDFSAELEETKGEATRLLERVTELESEDHNKAILKDWLEKITPDVYLEIGQKLGFKVMFEEATEPEAAEVKEEGEPEPEPEVREESEAKAEVEEAEEQVDPTKLDPDKYETRKGKVDEPGWTYLELFQTSYKLKE